MSEWFLCWRSEPPTQKIDLNPPVHPPLVYQYPAGDMHGTQVSLCAQVIEDAAREFQGCPEQALVSIARSQLALARGEVDAALALLRHVLHLTAASHLCTPHFCTLLQPAFSMCNICQLSQPTDETMQVFVSLGDIRRSSRQRLEMKAGWNSTGLCVMLTFKARCRLMHLALKRKVHQTPDATCI